MIIFGILIGAIAMALIWALSGIFTTKPDKPYWTDYSCMELFVTALEATGLRRIHAGDLQRGEYTMGPLQSSKAYTLIKIAPSLLWATGNIITLAFDHNGNFYAVGSEVECISEKP